MIPSIRQPSGGLNSGHQGLNGAVLTPTLIERPGRLINVIGLGLGGRGALGGPVRGSELGLEALEVEALVEVGGEGGGQRRAGLALL